jgi:cysteinyl-tRNA synthetase
MKIFDSKSSKKISFNPLKEGKVSLYVCGMTVYDSCHIGHLRTFLSFDFIVKSFKALNFDVHYVRNITDVDDKIIAKAKSEKTSPSSISEKYIQEMHDDFSSMSMLSPDVEPKVTEHMDSIISFIDDLISKNFAYTTKHGDVFFNVESFDDYGELSNRNLEDMVSGSRIEIDDTKKNPADFALWKISADEASWNSPWGKGRPGWHIECSAMSRDYLGKNFDIHGGGLDLKFPHHENENAQSKCNHNGLFANFWLHTGPLTIDEEKMSKSLGNFVTIKDILKRYHPEVIRFFLFSTHYRNPLNFSFNGLDESKKTLDKFYDALRKVDLTHTKNVPIEEGVIESLKDDFNSPKLVSFLHMLLDKLNKSLLDNKDKSKSIADLLISSGSVMGLFQSNPDEYFKFTSSELLITEEEIENLITDRNLARNQKDFMKSDKIRDDLKAKGITLEDVGEKTTWKRVNLDE